MKKIHIECSIKLFFKTIIIKVAFEWKDLGEGFQFIITNPSNLFRLNNLWMDFKSLLHISSYFMSHYDELQITPIWNHLKPFQQIPLSNQITQSKCNMKDLAFYKLCRINLSMFLKPKFSTSPDNFFPSSSAHINLGHNL